jgi:hypothetical protein
MGLRVAHRSTRRLTDASWGSADLITDGGGHPETSNAYPSGWHSRRASLLFTVPIGTSSRHSSGGSWFHNDVARAGNHPSAQRIAPFNTTQPPCEGCIVAYLRHHGRLESHSTGRVCHSSLLSTGAFRKTLPKPALKLLNSMRRLFYFLNPYG